MQNLQEGHKQIQRFDPVHFAFVAVSEQSRKDSDTFFTFHFFRLSTFEERKKKTLLLVSSPPLHLWGGGTQCAHVGRDLMLLNVLTSWLSGVWSLVAQ